MEVRAGAGARAVSRRRAERTAPGSSTNSTTTTRLAATTPAAMKKEVRKPNRLAEMPPISGPRLWPMKVAELSNPSERVRWALGVPAATRAVAAVTLPANSPCSIRMMNTASTERANARATARIMDDTRARMIISLRPKRSEIMPQNGAASAIPTIGKAAVTPTQSLSVRGSVTPSSLMYSGMNGMMNPKPVRVRICANQAR